jgi:hypothetical protein
MPRYEIILPDTYTVQQRDDGKTNRPKHVAEV